MKICFLGNFNVSYTSETHHALELEKLGHRVYRYQEQEATTDQVLDCAKKSDLFVWIKTHGWNMSGGITMGNLLAELEAIGVPSMSYHLDLFFGLNKRFEDYKNCDNFKVKHYFTVEKQLADYFNKHTKTIGHYLPAGVFSKEVKYLDLPKIHEVVFVGQKRYHKEWNYRTYLINWLEKTYGSRFEHYGNDGIRLVRGMDLNKLYASTKVVIGDTFCPKFDYPDYFSDRVFETTGRGGFIIHPYIEGIERYFRHPQEIVTYTYGDFDELKGKIDFYLANDLCRERVRRAGYDRTRKEHTYLHRWQHIINELGLN